MNTLHRNPTLNLSRSYSYYFYEPILKERHQQVIPTEEMYRFFPSKNQIININEKDPEDSYRYIFNGQKKTPFEEKYLNKLNDYINKKQKNNESIFPKWWLESDTMRFLQAADYKIEKAYDTIIDYIKFMKNISLTVNNRIRYILNSGVLYMYGRDNHFRPIIIIEVKRTDILEKEGFKLNELCECIVYFMNYIINYILIAGQIENWIIITDLDSIGMGKIGQIKNILGTLNRFRGRVFKNYIINVGGFISVGIKGVLSLAGARSAKKIKILKSNELNQLKEFIREDNIQQKYGGTAPNVCYGGDNLFPPIVPSNKYLKGDENLNIVSPEKYKEMCLNSNPFKPFVICEKYKKIWEKEEEMSTEKQTTNLRSRRTQNSILCMKDYINIFERSSKNRIIINQGNKLIPKKIDIDGIKNFFKGFKNI